MVYKLYGLTYDEVMVVDPETTITEEEYEREIRAHPTNPVECCADANPKTMLPNDT